MSNRIPLASSPLDSPDTGEGCQDLLSEVALAWTLQASCRVAEMPYFVTASPAMCELLSRARKASASRSPVLITGETGTGKELLARYLHLTGARGDRDLTVFNCAELMPEMAESQLFGHRRGSFTGAVNDFLGLIRAADGGTLLLDEIGEVAPALQPKLLRFLQEGEVLPLGHTRAVKVDVRLIAATNCDLEAAVRAGRFRADLYHRLNVIRLHLAPLRERRDEIAPLIAHYTEVYARRTGKRRVRLSRETVERLHAYDWPGNVRELCHELERLVLFADEGEVIAPRQLSPHILDYSRPAAERVRLHVSEGVTLAEAVAELERQMIARALERHGGNITHAARTLRMTRTGLRKAIARLAIERTTAC
jgi:transcriptional regulator with GAF, ATPase, and Fis domain